MLCLVCRIINVPPRKIGEGTADVFFAWLQSLKVRRPYLS